MNSEIDYCQINIKLEDLIQRIISQNHMVNCFYGMLNAIPKIGTDKSKYLHYEVTLFMLCFDDFYLNKTNQIFSPLSSIHVFPFDLIG